VRSRFVASNTTPKVVKRQPTKLGHGLRVGACAVIPNEMTPSRTPTTIDIDASSRIKIPAP